ncbi:MAG: hypothetical protein IT349_17810, partial [Candidatus Eisenbacteria bacterium]|nr:hypothetical protein [Candidatus Eisenbacteria bacterium]
HSLSFELAAMVGTTRGGLALEAGDGRAAWAEYARIDSLARSALRDLAEWTPEHLLVWWNERPAEFATWRSNPHEAAVDRALRAAALDLHRPWSERPRDLSFRGEAEPERRARESIRREVPEPTREEWHQLWSLVDSAAALSGVRRRLAEERDELLAARERDRVFYLRAREELESNAQRLDLAAAAVDSLERQARASLASLDRSRSATLGRWEAKLNEIRRRALLHRSVLSGMKLRLIEEPERAGVATGPGFASVRESLGVSYREAELGSARALDLLVQGAEGRLRDDLTELARRGWRPGLLETIARLRVEIDRQQQEVANDLDALDLRLQRDPNRPALLALDARLSSLDRDIESLQVAYGRERRATAEAALARARARVTEWRPRLEYGIAAALHEQLRSGQVSDEESPELAARAAARLRGFLADHPDSPARADVRFRLADVELLAARAHPAAYDPTVPLELLRSIWDQDPGFPHRDVVLFEIGVLETELGREVSGATLERFLSLYPHSEYAQEAEVRLGDLAFDQRDFGRAVPHYARATRGGSAALSGIAWYKLGWSHFNQDEFASAAADFSRLIDLYQAGALVGARFDLESESHEYLVHALARAGGADAFRAHFSAIGSRDYEERTLRGMNALLREHSLWNAAIDGARLYLQRFPLSARALEQARFLVDSYEQANRSADAHSTRMELADRFAAGSEWSQAAGDSLAADGDAFALALTQAAAEGAHARARETRARTDWAEAYRIYQLLLHRWPEDERVARWEMGSGEAAAREARHELAATHFYRAASRAQASPGATDSGEAALAVEAAFQELAALDAAYEAETPEMRLRIGTRFLDRSAAFRRAHGHEPRIADLTWREGGIAHQIGDTARAEATL